MHQNQMKQQAADVAGADTSFAEMDLITVVA